MAEAGIIQHDETIYTWVSGGYVFRALLAVDQVVVLSSQTLEPRSISGCDVIPIKLIGVKLSKTQKQEPYVYFFSRIISIA